MSQDESTANAVDTSTNEETRATDDDLDEDYSDLDLDVEDLNDEDEDDEETTESEESKDDTSANESTEETEEESTEDDATGERTDPDAEQRKRNHEAAQRRIAAKQARESSLKSEQNEYLDSAADRDDYNNRALAVAVYNQTVRGNEDRLINGYDKAVANIDLFKTDDPIVAQELDAALDEFQQLHVRFDKYGNPIEVNGDLYQFLASKAERIKRLTGLRVENTKKAKQNAKARTISTPSRAPQKSKDEDDGFDEVFKDD